METTRDCRGSRRALWVLGLALCACGQQPAATAVADPVVAPEPQPTQTGLMPTLDCVQAHVDARDAWALELSAWLQVNPVPEAHAGGFYAVLDNLCVRAPERPPVELFNAAMRTVLPVPTGAVRLNPDQAAAFNARQQAKQDMQDAVQAAIRAENRREPIMVGGD